MWSFANHTSHSTQCGVTTSHSTCSGCCVCDYHICFPLFVLLNPPVPTLCLKDAQSGGWYNSTESSLGGQVIWVARLSTNWKNRENPCWQITKMFFLLKHVCETINNKQTMFAFLAKRRRRKNIERGVIGMTLMSLKSGTLNFWKVWKFFGVPRL